MLKEKITVGEAINLINTSILDFQDGLASETISKLIYSINNEIQVRDYLLGLPNTFPIETCIEYLSYLSASVDGAERYSLDTVNSAYHYEIGEMELSAILLSKAIDTKSNYSLAQLLQRVILAGLEPESFAEMRNNLHSKVIALLEESSEQLIEMAE